MAIISPFSALRPSMSKIAMPFDFFSAAKKRFNQYLQNGFYKQAEKESLYICRIQRPHRSHTGLIACAGVLDYVEGHIKKHENTLNAKEDKMLKLFFDRNAMIKPILLTYPNAMEIDALINRLCVALPPTFVVPFADETHTFWEINQPNLLHQLVILFQNHVPATYICDGHHRAASSERYYNEQRAQNALHTGKEAYNFMLAAYFPISEIEVHNFNRYINQLPMTANQFMQRLTDYFTIAPSALSVAPSSPHQIGMYLQKQWYRLDFRPEVLPALKKSTIKDRLDVELLNKLVFEQILQVEDVRTEENIQYIEGVQGARAMEQAVDSASNNGVGFIMYPVALEDLLSIANADGTMPPKSTWIEPRMRNGFVVQAY